MQDDSLGEMVTYLTQVEFDPSVTTDYKDQKLEDHQKIM